MCIFRVFSLYCIYSIYLFSFSFRFFRSISLFESLCMCLSTTTTQLTSNLIPVLSGTYIFLSLLEHAVLCKFEYMSWSFMYIVLYMYVYVYVYACMRG